MYTTLIGSMPYTNPRVAVEKILNNITIPCWPQLPKRSFKEHMCVQYSEVFPGIEIDVENNKIYFNEKKFYQEVESFYQNYLDRNYDYFKISRDFAEGFYKFLEFIPMITNKKKNISLKFQTTGPITFGFSIKDSSGKPIFYDLQLQEMLVKHITIKSLWQIKKILENIDYIENKKINLILFYDEPYLAAYGSAFTAVSKEELINILDSTLKNTKELLLEITEDKNISLKIGVHCCANTDWSILTNIDSLDIISFDAYDFFEHFILYSENIKYFLENNGIIAWGIVPNSEKILLTSIEDLIDKLRKHINTLISKGISKELIYKNLIITPQCGLGNIGEDVIDKVLEICKKFSERGDLCYEF